MKALRKRVADHDVQRWASGYLEALAAAPDKPHRPSRRADERRSGDADRANRDLADAAADHS